MTNELFEKLRTEIKVVNKQGFNELCMEHRPLVQIRGIAAKVEYDNNGNNCILLYTGDGNHIPVVINNVILIDNMEIIIEEMDILFVSGYLCSRIAGNKLCVEVIASDVKVYSGYNVKDLEQLEL